MIKIEQIDIDNIISAINNRAKINNPNFTGTVSGITKSMVGLGNVDNTSDANKPISTAEQTALNLKANLISPTFTGTPSAPTAAVGTNTTQVATTAFVTTNFVPFIGGTVTGSLTVNGTLSAGSIIETSSIRFKENVQNIINPLETVNKLQGVTYTWIESGKGDVGFIAEEIEKVIPELVEKSEDGVVQGMNYGKLTALLVEVVKTQQLQIDELKGRLDGITG